MRSLPFLLFVAVSALAQSAPPEPGQLRPLTTKEKFDELVVRSLVVRGLVGGAVGAAIGQSLNSPHEWGQGVQGFATRYVSGFGGTITRQSLLFAIDALDHEDPRFYPSEASSMKERLLYALKQTIWTHHDDGSEGFAYGRVVSAFANGQLVNVWQPASNNSPLQGVKRSVITLGTDAGLNEAQELFAFLRTKYSRHGH